MKRLKYIFTTLSLLFVVLALATSCEESNVDVESGIDMSNEFSSLTFSGEKSSDKQRKNVIITTSDKWTLSTPDEWVHMSSQSGHAGKNSFYVSVDANYGSATRYGTIEIQSGVARRTIIVEQSSYQYIDVSSNSYLLDGRGHTLSLIVATNLAAKDVELSMSAEASEWIKHSSPTQTTIDEDKIELKYTLYVSELPEEALEAREADVVVSYSKIGIGQTINITQSLYPEISIESAAPELLYYEQECSVDVISNADYVVEIPESNEWLTLNEEVAESGSTKSYTFTLEENGDSIDPRECEVKFAYYAKNEVTNVSEEVESVTQKIKIKQSGKSVDLSFVDESKYTALQSYTLNESFEVALNSNVELTASIENSNSWITLIGDATAIDVDDDETNGDDKIYTFTLKLAQNESTTDSREETINFTNTIDPTKSLSIKITQDKVQPFVDIEEVETLPYDADDSFEIVVTANDATAPTTTIGDNSWIQLVGEATQAETTISGVYEYTYTFNVESNFYVGAQSRTSQITFASSLASDNITLTQEAREPNVVVTNESDILSTQPFDVGSIEVNITSDIPLDAQIETTNGWTIESNSVESGYEIIVTIPNNNDTSLTPTATLKLSNSEYKYTNDLVITQESMPATYSIDNFTSGTLATTISTIVATDYSRVVIAGEALTTEDFTALTSSFTNMEYLDISATATSAIPDNQFKDFAMLKYIELPSSLESIGYNSFYKSGLLSITIPASVKSWGADSSGSNDAFRGTPLTSVTFESGLTTMGCRTFYQCTALTSIYIPASITEWNISQLTTVAATNNTNQAFAGCSSLTYAELESGRTEFPSSVFNSCGTPFTLVSHCEIPPTITCPGYQVKDGAYTGVRTYYIVNGGVVNSAQIYVPKGCVEAYSAAVGWSDQKLINEIE